MRPYVKHEIHIVVLIAILAIWVYTIILHEQYINKIKSGEIQFECSTKENGTFIVDPTKITSVDTDLTTVYFINGYATNCRVIK